ncbi:MAG: NTP transferase domain-containing protein [Deltaproteobacteria bacterium]|nr:NTP transferase domain-containing protein [Deltaproteobacteria bacterium]
MQMHEIEKTDVLVLCGGAGTRLRSKVRDRPKPMADAGGRPFLDILIDYAASCGFRRFILLTGYMGDFIERYYRERNCGLSFTISREKELLGTAGAIKNAQMLIQSRTFICLNGDSICGVNLKDFIKFHAEQQALATVVLNKRGAPPQYYNDYGAVRLGHGGRITNFGEKTSAKGGYVNCGIYAFERPFLSLIPGGKKLSLERDIFPRLIEKAVYGWVTAARFFDIGTPERFSLFVRSLSAG